eukprot:3523025-Amphidinium_carterae.1
MANALKSYIYLNLLSHGCTLVGPDSATRTREQESMNSLRAEALIEIRAIAEGIRLAHVVRSTHSSSKCLQNLRNTPTAIGPKPFPFEFQDFSDSLDALCSRDAQVSFLQRTGSTRYKPTAKLPSSKQTHQNTINCSDVEQA